MYVYSPMDLPVHLIQRLKKDEENRRRKRSLRKRRLRQKKKPLTKDADLEYSNSDGAPNDTFDNDYFEYSDDSLTYEYSDPNIDLEKEGHPFENTNDTEILDEQDILIIKTLINLKFSLPNLTSPQPLIESTFQLVNERISNSMSEMAEQVTLIKQLTSKAEAQISNTTQINKEILNKTKNFRNSLKQTHQKMKILGNVPLFHRILFKIQDLFLFIAPYIYQMLKYLFDGIFNRRK